MMNYLELRKLAHEKAKREAALLIPPYFYKLRAKTVRELEDRYYRQYTLIDARRIPDRMPDFSEFI